MSFKDMVAEDIHKVFLNTDEFAENRTIRYGYDSGEYAEEYRDTPIVLTGLTQQDRPVLISDGDKMQGLHLATDVLICALSDLNGQQPEKGQRIAINDQEGGGGFFKEFYVASSTCKMGMLRVELEAVGE